MKNKVLDGSPYLIVPTRLELLVESSDFGFTPNHIYLYIYLWRRAVDWEANPVMTNRLDSKKLYTSMGWERSLFYKTLKDLIDYQFLERIYENGRKRVDYVKVRFLPDPVGKEYVYEPPT